MVNTTQPWVIRGGEHNNSGNAGVFSYNNGAGVYVGSSFRQSKITSKKYFICKVYF